MGKALLLLGFLEELYLPTPLTCHAGACNPLPLSTVLISAWSSHASQPLENISPCHKPGAASHEASQRCSKPQFSACAEETCIDAELAKPCQEQ